MELSQNGTAAGIYFIFAHFKYTYISPRIHLIFPNTPNSFSHTKFNFGPLCVNTRTRTRTHTQTHTQPFEMNEFIFFCIIERQTRFGFMRFVFCSSRWAASAACHSFTEGIWLCSAAYLICC